MVRRKDKGIEGELQDFCSNLTKSVSYRGTQRKKGLTPDTAKEMLLIWAKLVPQSGKFAPIIADLMSDGVGYSYEKWKVAFTLEYDKASDDELLNCWTYALAATGKLESDIANGIRDNKGNVIAGQEMGQPKCFISHSGVTSALTKVEQFLNALGVEPLIVKDQPSSGKNIYDKVTKYLSDSDCVLILATKDDKQKGKLRYPGGNVLHEIGLAQKTHRDKIIYLLEQGAEFPSNINAQVRERFTQANMEEAFKCIVTEMVAFKLLKAVKTTDN